MARRGRKHRGGKMKAIPVAPLVPVIGTVLSAYTNAGGFNRGMLSRIGTYTTGYNVDTKSFALANAMPFWTGEIAGIIVHKVANKTVNKYIRKATMGYLVL